MLVAVLSILGASYVAIAVLAFVAQRRLLFPAPPTAVTPSASQVIDLPETVLLFRAPPDPTARVVVHFHGNGEQIAWTQWMADAWQQHGLGFVAVEYPGYGLAKEKSAPSEASIVKAAEAAIGWLEGQGVTRERLIISGQSVGSGVAVELASRGIGQKLVLFTPYTSLPDVAASMLPFLPVKLLMRDRFDSASKAANVKQPTLIIHGTSDEVVPFVLGEQLSKLLPNATLVRIDGGHHNDVADRPEVWSALAAFVR